MSEKLTMEWLKELVKEQVSSTPPPNSILLEAPMGQDIEIRNDLPWSEMSDLLNGKTGVESIAILTPENPLKWKGDKRYDRNEKSGAGLSRRNAENAELRRGFEDDLESKALRLYAIQGSYGIPENSYIIPGLSRQDAIKIGVDYGQDSIIHGQRIEGEAGPALQYQMIYTSKGSNVDEAAGTRYVAISGPQADIRDDLYSTYNGTKFYIPFYEKEYEGVVPQDLKTAPEGQPTGEVPVES